jgi:hypothetical protein
MATEELNRETAVAALKKLREELEEGTGQSIAGLEITAALFLSDICAALGLAENERDTVLGEEGASFVEEFLSTPIVLVEPTAILPKAVLQQPIVN